MSGFKPEVGLEDERPVFVLQERIRKIVIGINNEQVAHRFEAPLQAAVDIEIIILVVVLEESGPEQIV